MIWVGLLSNLLLCDVDGFCLLSSLAHTFSSRTRGVLKRSLPFPINLPPQVRKLLDPASIPVFLAVWEYAAIMYSPTYITHTHTHTHTHTETCPHTHFPYTCIEPHLCNPFLTLYLGQSFVCLKMIKTHILESEKPRTEMWLHQLWVGANS